MIYQRNTARIKLDREGPPFHLNRGVKQGDPLSLDLFISLLESTFKQLDWHNKRISIDGKLLNHLRFADDITLIASSAEELQFLINSLCQESKKKGLIMNMTKTKLMTNCRKTEIIFENTPLEYVDEFSYLGQCVSFQNKNKKEIQSRIARTWKAFWAVSYLRDKEIPLGLKQKLIDSCLLPVLTYGCQTWATTSENIHKLSVCQRAIERKILHLKLKDRGSNNEIRSRTNIKDVVTTIRKLKWKWAGHLMRTNDDRWSKRLTEWTPWDMKRGRGRKHKRWRDDLDSFEKNWRQLTSSKKDWSSKGEAFALLRDV